MSVRTPVRAVLATACVLLLPGCASIMQGTSQQIAVGSSPTGARVTIDSAARGTTPVLVDLKRKDNHLIKVEADGFEPYEMALSRSVSGWVWGNIVFGGVVGLAVDAITGGMYKLSPEQVTAQLASSGARVAMEGDRLLLTVVLAPEPGWERVGMLEREGGR